MTDTDDFPALAQARALWAGKDKARALAAFAAASDERPANLKARLEHAAALNQSYELGAALEMLATARDLAGSDPRLLTPVAAGYAAAFREGTAIAILAAIPTGQRRRARSLQPFTNGPGGWMTRWRSCRPAASWRPTRPSHGWPRPASCAAWAGPPTRPRCSTG